MDLITALAEAQKCQEATLEEMKGKLEDNQMKLDGIIEERQTISNELDTCKKVIKDMEFEKTTIQKEYEDLLINSRNEIDYLKKIIEKNEAEWTKLLNERKQEINAAEIKLTDAEVELAESFAKIQQLSKREAMYTKEFKKLKQLYIGAKEDNDKMKNLNENLEKKVNEIKIELLKVSNNNDRLIEEIKWSRKQVESYKNLWENLKQEKVSSEKQHEELKRTIDKNAIIEIELQDLKQNMECISRGNQTIVETVQNIRQSLVKESKTVYVQTAMTNRDLSKYEHLDKEATLLVIGLREELVAAKDELIRAKEDNDEMKVFINESRRQMEVTEEEQRVQRLEQTVESLTHLVNKDAHVSPRSYHEAGYSYDNNAIMDALGDVKKDLALLKTRNWNRVVRSVPEVEVPTRDQADFSSLPTGRNIPQGGMKSVKFHLFPRK